MDIRATITTLQRRIDDVIPPMTASLTETQRNLAGIEASMPDLVQQLMDAGDTQDVDLTLKALQRCHAGHAVSIAITALAGQQNQRMTLDLIGELLDRVEALERRANLLTQPSIKA